MRRKLIAGNWKMNGALTTNATLLAALRDAPLSIHAEMAVCVPAVYLAQAQAALSGSAIAWGAQDCSAQASGAYTGEVSATMLNEFGCQYAIVGHSERRQYHGESSEEVAAKAKAVLDAGMTPIVCIGETLAQREAGQTLTVVNEQLQAVLVLLGESAAKMVLAYEPVWAIGTGKVATPEQAQEVHAAIRAQLRTSLEAESASTVRILYGGSMKPDNAKALLSQKDIDGGLIGGASLKVAEFLAIYAAA